jgi:hypothetical protein
LGCIWFHLVETSETLVRTGRLRNCAKTEYGRLLRNTASEEAGY